MTRALTALAIVALALAGCASRGSVQRVQAEAGAVRADLTELRRAQESTARDLARTVAELRTVETRATELQAALRTSQEEATQLRARLDAAEREIRETRTQATAPAPGPLARVPSGTPRPEPARPDIARADSPESAYAAAMAMFRAREHGQAVLDLLDFIAKYPSHPLTVNAQYWIGEAYYVQHDYRQALVEFQKVLRLAPTSTKAADALLKVGLCYTSLRDTARAQQTWQRLMREYPGSESAARARDHLRARASPRP
jgi:tol-pal system protein YbgF